MMWRLLQMVLTPLANIGKARPARIAALGGAFSLLCLGLLWCTAQGISWAWHAADHKLAQALDMRIKDVTIVGGKNLDVTETLERHGLEIGALVADVDWDGARKDLARNPMLQGASIARLSPERVEIRLTPRQPIARLDRSSTKGDTILVDRAGLKMRVAGQTSDKDLVALSGKSVFGQIDSFWPMLMAEPALFRQVREARYVGQRRWDLVLKDGAVVQLPESDAGLALRRVAMMLGTGRIDTAAVRSIDLRSGDRMFIRSKPNSEMTDVQTQSQG